MYEQAIIGFDCREIGLSAVENWSEEGQLEFLRPDIERKLTIDSTSWNSVFVTHPMSINGQWIGTAPGYQLRIPVEYQTSDRFWENLEDMLDFLKENKGEYQKPCWIIALTVVQSPKYVERLQSYLEDVTKNLHVPVPILAQSEANSEWTFLGYDVQDTSFIEGLGGGVYPDEYQVPLKEKWGKHLNKYHLFDDQQLALEYCDWQENAENHFYFVYGLYLIQQFPGAICT